MPADKAAGLKRVLAAKEPYTKIAGFDMNPEGTIAYTADTAAGIQKYTKENGAWQFAYNFSIPQTLTDTDNRGKGCFGITVDFSGKTTSDLCHHHGRPRRLRQRQPPRADHRHRRHRPGHHARPGTASSVFKGVAFSPENADSK